MKSAWLLAIALAATAGTCFWLRFLDWGSGPMRGLVLFEALTALMLLGSPTGRVSVSPDLRKLVWAVIGAGMMVWAHSIVVTIAKVERIQEIPQDQGQTTWRAARLLSEGHNPYGAGQLVDFQTYYDRLPQREAVEYGPSIPHKAIKPALADYDVDLSPAKREVLLPGAPRTVEAHLLGYKYGPLFPLLTLPLVAMHWMAGVMALNALAAALMVTAMYPLMRDRVGDSNLALLGVAALLWDNTIVLNYVEHSATDVFALLCCVLAVLAFGRGRINLAAVALAIGFGFKLFPCGLLLPLLIKDRRIEPALIFAAVAGAIYLPFAVAGPEGLLRNVFLWPAYLGVDTTSWLAFAPPMVATIARAAGLAAMAWVWARHLTGREPSLFRTLAFVAVIALITSGAFHNNYVPWASIWIVAAIVERFGPAFAARPEHSTPAAAQLAQA